MDLFEIHINFRASSISFFLLLAFMITYSRCLISPSMVLVVRARRSKNIGSTTRASSVMLEKVKLLGTWIQEGLTMSTT